MKISKQQAAENRKLILTSAARLFRERGVAGVGVDALGEAAGMTHGSLYSQFGSKEKLLQEALDDGFEREGPLAAPVDTIAGLVSQYLSRDHRDDPGTGCFMAALAGDMPRQGDGVRHSFTRIVKSAAARLAEKLPAGASRTKKNEMLAAVSSMVGAMILARAVDDEELSERLLSVTRTKLLRELR